MSYLERITLNPAVCHGKPCIRKMRWPVEVVLDMLGSGMSPAEIMEDHPKLEPEDFTACLYFAKLLMSGRSARELIGRKRFATFTLHCE